MANFEQSQSSAKELPAAAESEEHKPSLYERIAEEFKSHPPTRQTIDKNGDSLLSIEEAFHAGENKAFQPATQEYFRIIRDNNKLIADLDNSDSPKGVSESDQRALKDLVLLERKTHWMPTLLSEAQKTFGTFDINGNGTVDLQELEVLESRSELEKAQGKPGLDTAEMIQITAMKDVLLAKQVELNAPNTWSTYYKSRISGDNRPTLSREELSSLQAPELRRLFTQQFFANQALPKFRGGSWQDYAAGAVAGGLGYLVAGPGGLAKGAPLGYAVSRAVRYEMSENNAAQEGVRRATEFRNKNLDELLTRMAGSPTRLMPIPERSP